MIMDHDVLSAVVSLREQGHDPTPKTIAADLNQPEDEVKVAINRTLANRTLVRIRTTEAGEPVYDVSPDRDGFPDS